jgi:hypothetical protein
MNKLLAITMAAVAVANLAVADTVAPTGGTQWTQFPTNFASTLPASGVQGNPFWNDRSSDGAGLIGSGFILTGTGEALGGTAYLGNGSNAQYRSSTANVNNAPSSFSFVREASLINVSVLYTSAGFNTTTQIGIYNTTNPNQQVALFGPGTGAGSLFNPFGGPSGIYNLSAGATPSANNVNTNPGGWGDWGVYARVCPSVTVCHIFYSDTGVSNNQSGSAFANDNGIANFEALGAHAHFALFNLNSAANTFYVAFEDSFNFNNIEAGGDYNDVILRFTTSAVVAGIPEPASLSFVGLGLLGVGLIRKFRKK